MKKRKIILLLLLVFTLVACKKEPVEDFNVYTERLAKQIIEDSPINASFMYSDLEKVGLGHLLSQIDDVSVEEVNKMFTQAREILEYLDQVNKGSLSIEQQQTYDMLVFQNEGLLAGEKYLYYDNAFQPASGIQINMPIALMQIELESEKEVQGYIERCQQLPRLFDQYIAYEKERLKDQVILPPSLYEAVIEEINELLVEPEQFMMYLSFIDRVDALESLEAHKQTAYKAEFLKVVIEEIYPAYDNIKSALLEIQEQSKNTKGISEWKGGKAYYDYLIKYSTSYDMDGEDLRDWVMKLLEASTGKVQAYLAEHPEIITDEDLLSMVPEVTTQEQMIQIQDAFISEAFLDYGVTRASENIIPTYLEEHLPPAFYFPISLDGEDYGNMYMTQEAMSNITLATLETDMHENLPGHHMYFSVLYEKDLPLIRKVYDFNAYVEGWAQYVQSKVYEYSAVDDEAAEFWANLIQMNYAYSVLLDIQVHYDGLSKEEAIKAYIEMGYDNQTAESAYNRMIANPAELVDYYYGAYVFEGYLETCKSEMGDQFEIREFHDLILEHGGLPFKVMDDVVDDFIDQH